MINACKNASVLVIKEVQNRWQSVKYVIKVYPSVLK